MGKTFKNGYFVTQSNLRRSKQCFKKIDRKRRKIQYKNECDWIYKNYDDLELNTTLKSIRLKKSEELTDNSYNIKLGYSITTSYKLFDIENSIYKYKYASKKTTDPPDGFKNYKEEDKIKILIDETNYEKKLDTIRLNVKHHRFLEYSLKNMKKQLNRRCKIGYFKGHDKDYHNKHEFIGAFYGY